MFSSFFVCKNSKIPSSFFFSASNFNSLFRSVFFYLSLQFPFIQTESLKSGIFLRNYDRGVCISDEKDQQKSCENEAVNLRKWINRERKKREARRETSIEPKHKRLFKNTALGFKEPVEECLLVLWPEFHVPCVVPELHRRLSRQILNSVFLLL